MLEMCMLSIALYTNIFEKVYYMSEKHNLKYHKVLSSRLSRFVADLRIFRPIMKGKFDAYVLHTFGEKRSKLNCRLV